MSKGQEYKGKQWVGFQLTTEEGREGPRGSGGRSNPDGSP